MKKLIIIIALFLVLTMALVFGIYKINTAAVSKNSKEVTIVVLENNTYLTISSILKENNLIKSELFYKIYVKLNNPNGLEVGKYTLNQNMSVKEIIEVLSKGALAPDEISFVIPEGKHLEDAALYISEITDFTKEELINYWQSEELLNNLINKYWFITEDVKNKQLRYSLEGYFFPAKYNITKSSTKEEITYKMLDKMDEVLSKYKDKITNVHDLLTLASIVENEAILDEDRPKIARVFLNRLEKDMMLQSCATIGYAIDEWKLTYTNKDLAVDSPYNTYKYYGLPVGPGNLPGENSIKAVLYPDDNDYLYFLANVYSSTDNKTYYSKTYKEHQQKCTQYLGRTC